MLPGLTQEYAKYQKQNKQKKLKKTLINNF